METRSERYDERIHEATVWLFDEFLRWNVVQGELKAKGYPNSHCDDGEMARQRHAFQAIAERFVLEGVDFRDWQWFETPWAGNDDSTGNMAYVIDFVKKGVDEPEMGILGFYVTHDHRFWYALPLAELFDGGAGVYAVNSIETVLGILGCLNSDNCEITETK